LFVVVVVFIGPEPIFKSQKELDDYIQASQGQYPEETLAFDEDQGEIPGHKVNFLIQMKHRI